MNTLLSVLNVSCYITPHYNFAVDKNDKIFFPPQPLFHLALDTT